jgi:hypothetical protein
MPSRAMKDKYLMFKKNGQGGEDTEGLNFHER